MLSFFLFFFFNFIDLEQQYPVLKILKDNTISRLIVRMNDSRPI